jgi:hypothetical protein
MQNKQDEETKKFWAEFAARWQQAIDEESKLIKLAKQVVDKAEANAKDDPKTDQILVVVVEPDKRPYKKMITNDLEAMQKIVGGWIEHVTIGERPNGTRLGIILNEEGKLVGLPFNRRIVGSGGIDDFVGNIFIAAHNLEGDTVSLTDAECDYFIKKFKTIEVILN